MQKQSNHILDSSPSSQKPSSNQIQQTPVLFFMGRSAFTEFRLQQKLKAIQAVLPKITAIKAHYFFLAECHVQPALSEVDHLIQLLPHVEQQDLNQQVSESLWVVPRLGTISAWSSKATDIAENCDLSAIKRLERGIVYQLLDKKNNHLDFNVLTKAEKKLLLSILHDALTETLLTNAEQLLTVFTDHTPQPLQTIPVLLEGIDALLKANQQYGLALSKTELQYLLTAYQKLERDPTDAELMMFAQVNSEHCRHKIFNATWHINGEKQPQSLFSMIRNTQNAHPYNALIAYKDNAAVLRGNNALRFYINPQSNIYEYSEQSMPIVLKVETHNHPTAISPFPGAATGSGGEIRDEGATGRGAKPKAGLAGFSVSHLQIPDFSQPWEIHIGKPAHMASALQIMLEGPIGAASFNNEFGRPNLCGYFRTFEMQIAGNYGDAYRGYHKPIMLAGGIGNIAENHLEKKLLPVGAQLIVLGGPAMAIGLGGGSASSRASSEASEALDFASVQRSNPEMQRRCQEVIDACWRLMDNNPILSIHDVGAGGLSNALPELVEACERGAKIQLREIPNAAPGMTPLEIWCNEAQERYVLAIERKDLDLFTQIAKRERCLFAVVGEVTEAFDLQVADTVFNHDAVNLPMSVLFESLPGIQCQSDRIPLETEKRLTTNKIDLADAIKRVLQFPCVADKSFLITIGDRSITGLVTRDQMVGPWQVPVADVAVTASSYQAYTGEALTIGERAPVALLHPAASARLAVGEAITNIAASVINDISQISLSANWMACANYLGDGAGLYDAVQTIGMEICPALGISIPVGKDSLSMRAQWTDGEQHKAVTAPMTVVISAAAAVYDVRKTLTPALQTGSGETCLLLIDIAKKQNSLGASVLAQTYQLLGQSPADLDDPGVLKNFFNAIQRLNRENLILAYHDRSDGGLLVTLCEMMFAGHVGLTVNLNDLGDDPIASLFSEELGAVIQIQQENLEAIIAVLVEFNLADRSYVIAELNKKDQLIIEHKNTILYQESRVILHRLWSETSYRMQALRDNPDCAQQEYDALLDAKDPGLNVHATFNIDEDITAPFINLAKPKIAILREQGVNGQVEMAAAFDAAGFSAIDVHMSDILSNKVSLQDFIGLAACGGFSYGDVLGAGRGWANSILMHTRALDEFSAFFARDNTFTLGVCNGCQMLAHLKSIIPGADAWPTFLRNQSEQFEARLSLVEIEDSPSIFFKDMQGSRLAVTVAHGEGRVQFANTADKKAAEQQKLISLRYVDHYHKATEAYPFNPNGSPQGITSLTTPDGRATILMPHPERVFRAVQNSWHPKGWGEVAPWLRFFRNARRWAG